MAGKRDPVQRAASGELDLYDVAEWEPRSTLDGIAASVYRGLKASGRVVVIVLALLIMLAQVVLSGLAFLWVQSPIFSAYVLLSIVPALGLAAYVWKVDVTMREPLDLLVATFVLGILFAGFAAVLNTFFKGYFMLFGGVGLILFFYLIVAPIEETVKWLAVRLYAYRSDRFDAVIDGAVYGAMAGLGFATIENAIYIGQQALNAATLQAGLSEAFTTAAVRTFAGPGHVIYSAFAGYYLGLAKFNPDNRGPIVVKGLLIAALIHGTYNAVVTNLGAIVSFIPGLALVPGGIVFIGFILLYDGVFFYALYRKLKAYRSAFVTSDASEVYNEELTDELPEEEEVEFEGEDERREPVTGQAHTDETEDDADADDGEREPDADAEAGSDESSDRTRDAGATGAAADREAGSGDESDADDARDADDADDPDSAR